MTIFKFVYMVELVDTLDLKSNLLWGPSSSLGIDNFLNFDKGV